MDMITLALNIFLGIVGFYVAIRLAVIAIDWVREGLDCLRPKSKDRYNRR